MKVLDSREMPTSQSIFILFGVLILGYVIGNVLAAVVMIAMTLDGFALNDLANLQNKLMGSKQGWWALIIGQGVGSLFIFAVPAVFYWLVFEKKTLGDLQLKNTKMAWPLVALTFLITLVALPFIGWTGKVNEQMQLPASLSGVESFMKVLEEKAAELTKFMVSFTSLPEYIAAILVIAVVAGIGEELFFRGLLQRKIWYGTGNIHVAVWLAAAVFSTIHFQFYGFLPRMLLGAMFGYLYYWSGNLWVPILGHIFNNALSVTLMFASNKKLTDLNMENTNDITMPLAAASLLFMGAGMYFFHNRLNTKTVAS